MTWKGQFFGTTARGRAFSRTNDKVIEWTIAQSCVRVNGSSEGDVTGRPLHTDVIRFSRCKFQCPAAGSEIKVTDVKSNRSIDITYDGGPTATFTAPAGNTTQIARPCGL